MGRDRLTRRMVVAMKKIFRWLQIHNPWYLRRQNLALQRFIDKQNSELSGLRKLHVPDEQTARAMLMQLRVHQESVRHRTGYMVSAFIPEGVVKQISRDKSKFVSVVAEALVNNAINGILKRSAATSKLTALIFEPVNKHGQNVKLVGGFFETDRGPDRMIAMMPPSEHVDTTPLMLPQNS